MRILLSLLLAALVCSLAGCGGAGEPSSSGATTASATTTPAAPTVRRSAYAAALGGLCARRRSSLESIGNPTSPQDLEKLLPKQIAVMKQFSARTKALKASAREAKAKRDFDRFYATYLDGQIYALKTLKAKAYDGYYTVVDSALAWQKQAEKTAVAIGAAECARRPFDTG